MNGVYGEAFTKGFQEGSSDEQAEPQAHLGTAYWKASVIAKHYAVYSLETSTVPSAANNKSTDEGAGFINRHAFNAIVSDQDMAESYLPAFHTVVKSGASGIMCSCK